MPEAAGSHIPAFERLNSLPVRRSLGQGVFENLKRAIIEGDLPPESRIVESRVAEALGISRTPVREAIHKLEREGLLRQGPRGGFFVAGLSSSDIEETFGIRSVLESYAARLAALRHQEGELRPLEEKLEAYEKSLKRGDLDLLPRINTEFHDLLYGLSRSPRLIKMINDLRDHIYRFRLVILRIEEMARLSNRDHRLMLKAMRERDPDEVERLVREHILRGQSVVLREFDMAGN
ncbi:MAG: GntR family transcriptional regulator [Deltaproteobacteria bacterium]|nr:GntR family transcriptional regulator [Deltaproteobacteria bacterium]MBW2047613.1 GntR family transcriptional regulator [Deltaproteobacteria bacterium]MBW2112005.1 GntR family transcriptional regulator [Deltaproteobacteria bacterium]MBW2351960.1 GntR family transcriptional regulator [Deltaproteobacteria bacterium]HDZ89734.1 GntR family transcriptional regulator [Deltaproteobacteria bacterium]